MKNIESHIAYNLDRTWNFTAFKFIWIGFRFNGIEFRFLNWIQLHWIEFEFQFNSIKQSNSDSIEEEWKSTCEYGAEKKKDPRMTTKSQRREGPRWWNSNASYIPQILHLLVQMR